MVILTTSLMFLFMVNFYQFKGATTLQKNFFERIYFFKFKIHNVKFLQQNIVSNHNIEGFKQVPNYITCQ
jgi:hypothetical protein